MSGPLVSGTAETAAFFAERATATLSFSEVGVPIRGPSRSGNHSSPERGGGSAAALPEGLIPRPLAPHHPADGRPRSGEDLVQRNDHLIGANQPQVLADQLVGHVRIGLVGVEEVGAVLELGALLVDLGELGLPLLELAMIAAPGEDSVFAGDRMTGEG